MPSSLTVVLPIASVCSTRPPVSVLVRAPTALPRGFSRKHGLADFSISFRLASQDICAADFHAMLPTRFHGDVQNPAEPPPSVAPSVVAPRARCRNVCLLRVGYAYRPRLSPRLTLGGLALPRKPRVHGGRVTLSSLATHASILTPMRSTVGRPPASPPMGSSPTDSNELKSRRFGVQLSPVYCRRMSTRPVSCYALFECMAASKPTSWLSGRTHILCHSAGTWGP